MPSISTTASPLLTKDWQTLGAATYELGESPFWHPLEQMLYWIDIKAKKILRSNTNDQTVQVWDMPSEPGCIAPARSGGLVIALRDGIFRAREWGASLERITTLPYDTKTVRANDGKCDALGRFWVGTIDEPKASRAAELFSIDCRPITSTSTGASTNVTTTVTPQVQRQAGDALTANGLAWSLDNTTLYWADTPAHVVHAWDYDLAHNQLSAHRIHLRFGAKPADWVFTAGTPMNNYAGRPDGAAIDAAGNYWVAMFEGARVCCFAPDGQLLHSIATPAQCPTMPCFGGADLRTLFLCSARHGRSAAELTHYPQSGAVFYTRVETPGLAVNYFVDA